MSGDGWYRRAGRGEVRPLVLLPYLTASADDAEKKGGIPVFVDCGGGGGSSRRTMVYTACCINPQFGVLDSDFAV